MHMLQKKLSLESIRNDCSSRRHLHWQLTFAHDFANGFPTDRTCEKLFKEMDFQRAG
jgi:hypothetical protein